MNLKKIAVLSTAAVVALTTFTACSGGLEEKSEDNSYYTDFCMSELEYKMFISEKISLITSQLITNINSLKSVANGSLSIEGENSLVAFSTDKIKEAKQEVKGAYPPDVYLDNRDMLLSACQEVIDLYNEINEKLENKEITKEVAESYIEKMEALYSSIIALHT